MRIKFPVLLSTAVCLTFGSISNAEEAYGYGCPTMKPKKMCCCCCIVKPRPKPRPYIELGVGQALNARVDSGTNSFFSPDNPEQVLGKLTVGQESRALPTNLLLGAGWVWRELYAKDPVYLPYLSLGLQYQYTNLNGKKTTLNFTGQPINPETGEPAEGGSTVTAPFDFSQMSLLAIAKLDLYQWRNVMPYISLGLGASRNHAKEKGGFTTSTGQEVVAPLLSARNTSFSYSLGAGLDFPINDNFWLSLGYHYNNFGRIKIGSFAQLAGGEPPPPTSIFNQSFNLGNFNTHTIQLTGRYVFA